MHWNWGKREGGQQIENRVNTQRERRLRQTTAIVSGGGEYGDDKT